MSCGLTARTTSVGAVTASAFDGRRLDAVALAQLGARAPRGGRVATIVGSPAGAEQAGEQRLADLAAAEDGDRRGSCDAQRLATRRAVATGRQAPPNPASR